MISNKLKQCIYTTLQQKYEYFYNQIVITYLHVINIIINYCFELWGDSAATKWILLVSKLENHKICIEMIIIKFGNNYSLYFEMS